MTAQKKTPKVKAPSAAAKALHRKAGRHNWDDGVFKLDAILRDRACDHGTALLIYWMGAPGYYQQYKTISDAPPYERPLMRFLRALEKRLLADDFATRTVLFNPRFDRTTISRAGYDWTAEYADQKIRRRIPLALLEPSVADPAWEARGRAPVRPSGRRLT
jgi:hypothetical protein